MKTGGGADRGQTGNLSHAMLAPGIQVDVPTTLLNERIKATTFIQILQLKNAGIRTLIFWGSDG
jgi:hypothetical protein